LGRGGRGKGRESATGVRRVERSHPRGVGTGFLRSGDIWAPSLTSGDSRNPNVEENRVLGRVKGAKLLSAERGVEKKNKYLHGGETITRLQRAFYIFARGGDNHGR